MVPRARRYEPAHLVGFGSGGVEELAACLDQSTISWSLLRFQVRLGAQLHTKFMVVHCHGAEAPLHARKAVSACSQEVVLGFGCVDTHVGVTRGRELSVERVCRQLLPLFAKEGTHCSLEGLCANYIAGATALGGEQAATPQVEPVQLDEALQSIGEDAGFYDWALIDPLVLKLRGVGSGGLEEMKGELDDSSVLFGMLRLGLKRVFVHWIGSAVGLVHRGKCTAKLNEAFKLVEAHCSVDLRREAQALGDLSHEDLGAELMRLSSASRRKEGPAAFHTKLQEYISAWASGSTDAGLASDSTLMGSARKRRATIGAAGMSSAEKEQRAARQQHMAAGGRRLREVAGPAAASPQLSPRPAESMEDLRTVISRVRSETESCNWVLCGCPQAISLPQLQQAPAVSGCAWSSTLQPSEVHQTEESPKEKQAPKGHHHLGDAEVGDSGVTTELELERPAMREQ